MTNILVRDLSEATVRNLSAQATEAGLSRNEYLRRTLEQAGARGSGPRKITPEDWARFAEFAQDLADPEVMERAWQ